MPSTEVTSAFTSSGRRAMATMSNPAASLRHSPTADSTFAGLRSGVVSSRLPLWMWEATLAKECCSRTLRAASMRMTRPPTLTALRSTT